MHQEVPAHYFTGFEHSLQQLCRQDVQLAESLGIPAQAVTDTLALHCCLPRNNLNTKMEAHASYHIHIYITYHSIAHARCFEWKMFPQHWNSATLSLAFRFWSVIFINTSTRFQRKSTDTWKQTDTVKTNGLWAPSCKLPRLVSRQLLSFESSWKVFYKMVVMAGF